MSGLNRGGVPTIASNDNSGVGYWSPPEKNGGRNEVVLLSDVKDIASLPNFIKLFKSSAYSKSYPVTMTWADTGKDDPRHVLCPDEKPKYAALVWVAYEDKESGAWKVGAWIVSSSVHQKIYNASEDADLTGNVINVQKVGKVWDVRLVNKRKAPPEALKLEIPGEDVEERLMGVYENADAVWAELRKRLDVETNEEVMEIFGVGADSDTDLL